VSALLASQPGRDILAEVLESAAAVLRKDRTGQQVAGGVNALSETGTNVVSTAVDVGTDVASGAADAGAEITSAVVDMAETAAGALATMATGAVLNMLPGESSGSPSRSRRGGARKRRSGGESST
jgi:hypothetical protein